MYHGIDPGRWSWRRWLAVIAGNIIFIVVLVLLLRAT